MSLWVFGYGSLLWNPGFEVAERAVARLPGYARSFCMRSIHYRGTEEAPGLVLALCNAEAICEGMALRVPAGQEEATTAYLRERELISYAYTEARLPASLDDGREIEVLVYVMNEAHDQFAGKLPLEEQAQIIARARGTNGPNSEYLFNTAQQLSQMGLHDPEIEWLTQRVRSLTG